MVPEEHPGETTTPRPIFSHRRESLERIVVGPADREAHGHLCDAFGISQELNPGVWFGLDYYGVRIYLGGNRLAQIPWHPDPAHTK